MNTVELWSSSAFPDNVIFFLLLERNNSDFSIVATQFITSKVGIADCNFNFNFFFGRNPRNLENCIFIWLCSTVTVCWANMKPVLATGWRLWETRRRAGCRSGSETQTSWVDSCWCWWEVPPPGCSSAYSFLFSCGRDLEGWLGVRGTWVLAKAISRHDIRGAFNGVPAVCLLSVVFFYEASPAPEGATMGFLYLKNKRWHSPAFILNPLHVAAW